MKIQTPCYKVKSIMSNPSATCRIVRGHRDLKGETQVWREQVGVYMDRPSLGRLGFSPYKTLSYMKYHVLCFPRHEVETTGIGARLSPSFHLG